MAKKLYKHRHPILSATTAGSSVANGLTDAFLLGAQRAEDFIGAWIYTYNAPGSGVPINTLNRVVYTDFSSASAVHLRMLPAAGSGTYVTGTNYEVHYKFSPTVINDLINEILENMRHPKLMVITDVEDGNMEDPAASVATYWAASGTHAVTKTAIPRRVFFGEQSLRITGGATGVVSTISPNRPLQYPPETELLVEALVNLDNASASVRMRLFDVTNAAYIGDATATSVQQGWSILRFIADTPATCESVRVDFDVTDGENCDVNYLVVVKTGKLLHEFPTAADVSAFEWSEDLDQNSYYYALGDSIDAAGANNCYVPPDISSKKTWSHVEVMRNDGARRSWRFTLVNPPKEMDRAIWIEGFCDYAILSSDTDTTYAPEDFLVGMVYADLLEDWAQEDLDDNRVESFQAKMAKVLSERKKYGPRARHVWKDKGRVHGALR